MKNNEYVRLINDFFEKVLTVTYNRYNNKRHHKLLGLPERNINYEKYVFKIDEHLNLTVNGVLIQDRVWAEGKLLRAENRIKALALIDRNECWIYDTDDLIINITDYDGLEKCCYDDFMRDEIIDTIDPLIYALENPHEAYKQLLRKELKESIYKIEGINIKPKQEQEQDYSNKGSRGNYTFTEWIRLLNCFTEEDYNRVKREIHEEHNKGVIRTETEGDEVIIDTEDKITSVIKPKD